MGVKGGAPVVQSGFRAPGGGFFVGMYGTLLRKGLGLGLRPFAGGQVRGIRGEETQIKARDRRPRRA